MKVLFKHTAIIEFEPEELHALVKSLHNACHLDEQENPLKQLHCDLYLKLGDLYKEFNDKYKPKYPNRSLGVWE